MFDFPKVVASLEEVPARFQGAYSVGETGFVLADELADRLDVSALKSALEKERGAAREAEAELKGWRALGDRPEAVAGRLEQAGMLEAEAAARAEAAAGAGRAAMLADVAAAVEAAGGFAELLMPHLKARLDWQDGAAVVLDEAGTPRDGMGVDDLIAELRDSQLYGRAFRPSGAQGFGLAAHQAAGDTGIAATRGQMSVAEKAAFIAAQGHSAYLALPL